MADITLLIINPGQTSTKIALYKNTSPVFEKTIRHQFIAGEYPLIIDQLEFRKQEILSALPPNFTDTRIDAVIGRGGLLKPISGGIYEINDLMLMHLCQACFGEHASNLGAPLAKIFADEKNVPAYIVDGVTVDELDPIVRISGVPGIEKKSRGHPLNIKAVARCQAALLGKSFAEVKFVVIHAGSGISIAAVNGGKIIDINCALHGTGPFSTTRAGTLPLEGVILLTALKGAKETFNILAHESGLKGYLGTGDLTDVEKMIIGGDVKAKLVFDAMIFQIASYARGQTAHFDGGVFDGYIITGGMAKSKLFCDELAKRLIDPCQTPIYFYPSEEEMLAMAEGGLRALNGEEPIYIYQ